MIVQLLAKIVLASYQTPPAIAPPLIPEHARSGGPIELRYPTQYRGAYFLDDLKRIPIVAIVRPIGEPRAVSPESNVRNRSLSDSSGFDPTRRTGRRYRRLAESLRSSGPYLPS